MSTVHNAAVGIGLQESKGTYVAPTTWLPLMYEGNDDCHMKHRRNYVVMDLADGKEYQTSYYSAGEWAEGTLRFPLAPRILSAVFSWLQDRDAENQGRWASLLLDYGATALQVTDAKVRRARIDLVRGAPVFCTLDVCGLKMEAGSRVTPSFSLTTPYVFDEVTVEIASGGGPLTADDGCQRIRIELNNMVEAPEEGRRLANLTGVRCTGTLSRDFADSTLYDDFAAGQEAALLLCLERGAAAATVALPRVLYTGWGAPAPTIGGWPPVTEHVTFTALASTDGLTPPVVLA